MADAKIDSSEVAYISEDLTDVVLLFHRVGFSIATANARDEVKHEAHYITRRPGGKGALREVIELIMQAKGIWPEILKKYEIGD